MLHNLSSPEKEQFMMNVCKLYTFAGCMVYHEESAAPEKFWSFTGL